MNLLKEMTMDYLTDYLIAAKPSIMPCNIGLNVITTWAQHCFNVVAAVMLCCYYIASATDQNPRSYRCLNPRPGHYGPRDLSATAVQREMNPGHQLVVTK